MPIYSNSLLLVDIGNTNINYKKVDDDKIYTQPTHQFKTNTLPEAEVICVASVVPETFNFPKSVFPAHTLFAKTQKKHKNLINGYQDITQLGVDRWLSLIAVYEQFPQQNCLIIDIGSAITMDILKKDGQHISLGIMPGFNWLKSTKPAFNNVQKKDTFTSWELGCRLMIIETIISQTKKHQDYKIILTGGGAKYFVDDFKFDYQIYDNLVLAGLGFWHNNQLENKNNEQNNRLY